MAILRTVRSVCMFQNSSCSDAVAVYLALLFVPRWEFFTVPFMYCHFMEKAMMIRLMPNRNFMIGSSILVCLYDENLARKLEVLPSTEYVFHANKTCIYAQKASNGSRDSANSSVSFRRALVGTKLIEWHSLVVSIVHVTLNNMSDRFV